MNIWPAGQLARPGKTNADISIALWKFLGSAAGAADRVEETERWIHIHLSDLYISIRMRLYLYLSILFYSILFYNSIKDTDAFSSNPP